MQMFAKLCARPENMQDYGSSVGDSLPCQESSTKGSREVVRNYKTQRLVLRDTPETVRAPKGQT